MGKNDWFASLEMEKFYNFRTVFILKTNSLVQITYILWDICWAVEFYLVNASLVKGRR